jgi:TP901 family phage tail tape measure protein
MAFNAGAVYGQAILDSSKWTKGANSVNSSMGSMNKGVNFMKKAFLAAGTAIVGAMTVSIAKADKFQKAFSNVSTLVDTTSVNMQAMAKDMLSLDERLGSATELTDGLYQALSASVEPAKAVQFVGESAKFAKAALIDTNTAVDVITTGLNAYGMEADKATDISDKLFSVIKLGKTTGAELASVIGQSIPLFANMGISFDELGASVAVMTRQGISAASATTQLNATVNAFLKPSEEMTAAITSLGYESGEAMIEALGFKGAVDKLVDTTGGSKEALSGMFNNTRALRGVLALTGEGAADFSEILDQVTNSAGATQEAFDKQELTMDTFKNTADKLSVIVGNIGKAYSDQLAVGATEAADAMIDFLLSSQGAEIVSSIIANVSAGFETLKVILEPLVNTILKEMGDIWTTITEALDTATGSAADGAGAFKVLAIAGATASSAIKIISVVIQSAITNIGNLIDAISQAGGTIGSFFDFLTGKKTWEEVEAQAQRTGAAFEQFGKGVVDGVMDIFETAANEVETFSDRVDQSTKDMEIAWTTTYGAVKKETLNTYDELITGQSNLVSSLQASADEIVDIFQSTDEAIAESGEQTTTLLQNAWDEYFDSIQKQANNSAQSITDIFQTTADTLTSGFSKAFAVLGEAFVTGEDAGKAFFDALKEAGKEAVAVLLESLAKEFLVRALAAALLLRWGAAAGWTAAAAAAMTGAGAIRALRRGGVASGPVLVGEEGPELLNLGSVSRVQTAEETNNILNQGGMTNNFYVTNEVDAMIVTERLGRMYRRKLKAI